MARFAALGDEDHPATARRRAALSILDTIGTMLAGAELPSARAARAAATIDGEGSAPMIGSGATAGTIAAAMANGVVASALDLDDGHTLGGSIHPGAGIVPSLLSVAEPSLPLDDLITANLVAYEVAIRAGYLLWPAERTHQAHMAGTPAAIGGAIGAARLRGLDSDGMRRALEIGAAHTPVAALQFPQLKESLGWAAATAAASCLLAEAGFKGGGPGGDEAFAYHDHPPTPFDRIGADQDFVTSLGARYEIEHTYFKPYGACRFIHSAADALGAILEQASVHAEEIEAIQVRTHREAAYLNTQRPSSVEEAQYSFPFALALLALEPDRFPLRIGESALQDRNAFDLAARIEVVHEPALDRHYPENYPCRVLVSTRDGRLLEREEIVAWGSPEKPMSEADLRRKFLALADPSLGADASRLWVLFDSPSQHQIADLMVLLRAH